jgi:hypothetical protein
MRTFSPCWNALTVCTGVAKSTTSSLRRRFSGREVFRNSITMFWPCCRMSIPVDVSVRSMRIRPSPAAPRRKSTSRIACLASTLPSAKFDAWPGEAPSVVVAAEERVTTIFLPSSATSWATVRRRLSTRRVRSDPCTRFMLRSSPCPTSCALRPSALLVPAKSNTMRAGLATVKLGGAALRGSLVVIRTTTLPPCWPTSKDSMLFACANAVPAHASVAASPTQNFANRLNMIISRLPAFAAKCCAQPNPRRCPGPLP